MSKTNSGQTDAGSTNRSETFTAMSDPNLAVGQVRGTTGTASNNPSAGSQVDGEVRYAPEADGGPPNGGLVPGTHLDKRTNRIFTVGYPPRARPSHLGPPTFNTFDAPFVRIHGFQELGLINPAPDAIRGYAAPHGAGSQHTTGSGAASQRNSGSGSQNTIDPLLVPIRSSSKSTSPSNSQSGSQQGSRRA